MQGMSSEQPNERPRRLLLLLALALTAAACVEPLQNGGVVLHDGADARIGAMCRFRRGAEGREAFCAPEAEGPQTVAVRRVAREKDLLHGPRAEGKAGDWLLDNGEISVIVEDVAGGAGGDLLDAADTRVGQDELGRLSPCLGAPLGCAHGEAIRSGQETDGSAWIEVRGRARDEARVVIATRYALAPGARALLVTTIVASRSSEPMVVPALGDAIAWGSAEEAIPGKERGFRGAAEGTFVAAVGKRVAYAITPADDHPKLEVESAAEGSLIRSARDVTLPPGGALRYERALIVAPRGDTLGLLTDLALLREGRVPGAIEVRFVDGAKPVAPPAGARLRLVAPGETLPAFLQIAASPGPEGVAAEAPPGKYLAHLESASARIPVEVRSGEVTSVTIPVSAAPPPEPARPDGPAPSQAP
jgi:hypothetical protein